MQAKHSIYLMLFFSIIILLILLVFRFVLPPANNKQRPFLIPRHPVIPAQRVSDLQTIQSASSSGTIICADDDPSICESNQEGKVLEYIVGCTKGVSSSSVYICRKGRWEYIDWKAHGACACEERHGH